jgi:hypothetical protein
MLPPEELGVCLLWALEHHVGLSVEEAVVEALRLLGFKRTGSGIRDAFDKPLRGLLADGRLVLRGESLYLGEG